MTIFTFKNYREILLFHFEQRSKKNVKYSLRAYARDLKISSTQLNDILNRKAGFSRLAASVVANQLKLNKVETDYFITLVSSLHARSKKERALAQTKTEQLQKSFGHFSSIDLDKIEVTGDWRHFAVLESCNLKDFDGTPKWVASKMNLTENEVIDVLNRLHRLNFVLFDGKKFKINENVNTNFFWPSDVPSVIGQSMHQELFMLAARRIKEVPTDKREMISSVVAVRSERIPEIKQKIRSFLSELLVSLDSDNGRDALYRVGVQFFPH